MRSVYWFKIVNKIPMNPVQIQEKKLENKQRKNKKPFAKRIVSFTHI